MFEVKKVFKTPTLDKLMEERGFVRCNDIPVFIRDNDDYNKEKFPYYIVFPVDFYAHYGMFESVCQHTVFVPEVEPHFIERIVDMFAKTYVTQERKEFAIAMLTADFYMHHNDKLNAEKWVKEYEKISGQKYN